MIYERYLTVFKFKRIKFSTISFTITITIVKIIYLIITSIGDDMGWLHFNILLLEIEMNVITFDYSLAYLFCWTYHPVILFLYI